MAEFAPEVVRLFAEKVRSLCSCNRKLTQLFLFAASAADQQQNSLDGCSAVVCLRS
jgi:hypothetical protein